MRLRIALLGIILAMMPALNAQSHAQPAADSVESWLPLLEGKKVALVAHQASIAQGKHLVDVMLENEVHLIRIFSPEHGFYGNYAAGEKVTNAREKENDLPLVSLYGDHKKPTVEDLRGVDCLVFDLQDVGARFYTYISTLTYVMEACAENGVPMIILDRPNPNGDYVDGPILDPAFQSFVGMHPVPIVHGMTMGEYARMVNGEGWLKDGIQCELQVVSCADYSHADHYVLPVAPSPNLPNQAAVTLYPSLCLFEGTPVSVGRGTDKPFQMIGAPWFPELGDSFVPQSVPAAPHPKFEGEKCFGVDLESFGKDFLNVNRGIYLFWLIESYAVYDGKEPFFTPFFDKLAGSDILHKQIEAGMTEESIRKSWEPGLRDFKEIRKKYLIYSED